MNRYSYGILICKNNVSNHRILWVLLAFILLTLLSGTGVAYAQYMGNVGGAGENGQNTLEKNLELAQRRIEAAESGLLLEKFQLDQTTVLKFTNWGSIPINTIRLWSENDFILFFSDSTGTIEKTPMGVLVYNNKKSLEKDDSVKFALITDSKNPEISWKTLDKNDKQIHIGTLSDAITSSKDSSKFVEALNFSTEVPKFFEPEKGISHYINRYHDEPNYKNWFETNYPKYEIWQAIGVSKQQYDKIVGELTESESNQTESKTTESTIDPEPIQPTCKEDMHLEDEQCVTSKQLDSTKSNSEDKLWIKYDLAINTDTNSGMFSVPSFGFSLSGGEYPFGAYSYSEFLDTKFLKIIFDETEDSKITLITKAIKNDGSEEHLNQIDMRYGENIFVINPDIKLGEPVKFNFPNSDQSTGIESISLEAKEFTSILVGKKDLDAIKSAYTKTISFQGGIGKIDLTTFHEKNTGILLLLQGNFDANSGNQYVNTNMLLNAVDVSDGFLKPNLSPGGGCLIATAAYGSELSAQVQQLREFRDNKLLQTESGTNFMNAFNSFYYSFSPVIADYERQNPIFKEVTRLAITPLISSLSILNYANMDSESEIMGYGISIITLNLGMYFGAPVLIIIGVRQTSRATNM